MHEIIDSPFALGEHAGRLSREGVRVVIRFYNNRNSSTFPSKCLTAAEYKLLTEAGLEVAVVFQQRGGAGGFLDDFAGGKGKRDAARALELARTIGQPEGSGIYFGVDHDFFRPTELAQLERYFREVKQELAARFRIGVYGSGAVCTRLKEAGLAELFWLPASMGWSGSRAFLASQQWTLFQKFQNLHSDFGGFGYDGNLFNPGFADFGQFGRGDEAVSRPVGFDGAARPAVFEVSARGGLNLRGGAGEQFAVLRTLPLGSIVHGMGVEGSWVQVDTGGDGAADGYMARDFLRPVSGGLPLPSPISGPARTAFLVAQEELALDVREVAGREDNPRIVLYHSTTKGGAQPDETAWCSSFVNYCIEQAGRRGTDSKWARSWHDDGWGVDVTGSALPGDVVVWRRRHSGQEGGHVGFLVERLGDESIRVLGGNQSNRVRIATYPVAGDMGGMRYDLLSIRR